MGRCFLSQPHCYYTRAKSRSVGDWTSKHIEYLGRDFYLGVYFVGEINYYFYVVLAGSREEASEFRAIVDISVVGDKYFNLTCKGAVGCIDDVPKIDSYKKEEFCLSFSIKEDNPLTRWRVQCKFRS